MEKIQFFIICSFFYIKSNSILYISYNLVFQFQMRLSRSYFKVENCGFRTVPKVVSFPRDSAVLYLLLGGMRFSLKQTQMGSVCNPLLAQNLRGPDRASLARKLSGENCSTSVPHTLRPPTPPPPHFSFPSCKPHEIHPHRP